MKINFTKKEYRALLDIIQIADWVMYAHDVEEKKETEEYRYLFQKIYSFAKEMGFDDLIEYVKEDGKFYPTRKFEDESMADPLIQNYENKSFWEELINRLAQRDVLKEKQIDSLAKLSEEELIVTISKAEEKWVKEFEAHDLDRISVNQTFNDVVH